MGSMLNNRNIKVLVEIIEGMTSNKPIDWKFIKDNLDDIKKSRMLAFLDVIFESKIRTFTPGLKTNPAIEIFSRLVNSLFKAKGTKKFKDIEDEIITRLKEENVIARVIKTNHGKIFYHGENLEVFYFYNEFLEYVRDKLDREKNEEERDQLKKAMEFLLEFLGEEYLDTNNRRDVIIPYIPSYPDLLLTTNKRKFITSDYVNYGEIPGKLAILTEKIISYLWVKNKRILEDVFVNNTSSIYMVKFKEYSKWASELIELGYLEGGNVQTELVFRGRETTTRLDSNLDLEVENLKTFLPDYTREEALEYLENRGEIVYENDLFVVRKYTLDDFSVTIEDVFIDYPEYGYWEEFKERKLKLKEV